MRRRSSLQIVCRLVVVFLALVLPGGCLPVETPSAGVLAGVGQDSVNSARLSSFLVLRGVQGPTIRLEVTAIEVLVDDLWLPVASGRSTIDSAAIGAGQLFLGGEALPPGQYQRLRLTIVQGLLRQADGSYAVITAEPFVVHVNFPDPLRLDPGESRVLFLTWDVEESLAPDNTLRPAISAAPQLRQLPGDLVYVSCPDIDTVFVVRADRNWVVDGFGLKGRPTWLAIDTAGARQRLYVLAAGEATIKVVDLSSHRVTDFFSVPLNDVPTYMTISPDGRWAYLLDERSGYLSRMDLNTGRSAARVRIGVRPRHAVYLERQNLLAVSLSISQTVVLLDPLSLRVVRSIGTGSGPQGLLAVDNQLYVAESSDNMVSVMDLAGQGTLGRIPVGFGPYRLAATDNVIYVSNMSSLSVLIPGQLGVIRELYGLGRPMEMVFDRFYRQLYVAEKETAALAVIDVNSNLLSGRISLGAIPAGLAILQRSGL